jgi:hypothetical protein
VAKRQRELMRCWLVKGLLQVLSWFPNLLKAISASQIVTGRVPERPREMQMSTKMACNFLA